MQAASNKKTKYIYILSQRYSGSTLLSFLLSTHPEISTIGERRKFYNKVINSHLYQHHKAKHCSCGEKFIECNYLNEIKEELLPVLDQKDLKTNATELKIIDNKYVNKLAYEFHKIHLFNNLPDIVHPFNSVIESHKKVNENLVKIVLKKDGSSAFLDSSKIINHALYLSQIEDFDFHVLWLVRDPRAQINSAMKYHKWDIKKATSSWIKEMKNNQQVINKLNLKAHILSYSKLCNDTRQQMEGILNFVGLDSTAFSLAFKDQEHHIMGNHMRFSKDQEIKERNEWVNTFTKEQIDYISKATEQYAEYYADV